MSPQHSVDTVEGSLSTPYEVYTLPRVYPILRTHSWTQQLGLEQITSICIAVVHLSAARCALQSLA